MKKFLPFLFAVLFVLGLVGQANTEMIDYAIYGGGNVDLGGTGKYYGLVGSGGNMQADNNTLLGAGATGGGNFGDGKVTVNGDLLFNGNVTLKNQSTINGDVTAGGTISTGGSATLITGTKTSGAAPPFSPETLPSASTFSTNSSNDVSVGNNVTKILDPGMYGNLSLGGQVQLYLSAGTYTFDEISTGNNLKLYLDLSSGALEILTLGNVAFGSMDVYVNGVHITTGAFANQALASMVYAETGGNWTTGNNAEWFGTIYAPEGNIGVGSFDLIGAMYAGENITFGNTSNVEFIGTDRFQTQGAPVPEPATMFLLGSGLIGVGAFVRRKFKK